MAVFRKLAIAYSIVVVLAAGWAFYVDARLLQSDREHLLPDIVLMMVTLPGSLSVSMVYEAWPECFSQPFAQVVWMLFCGEAQAALLFLTGALVHRRRRAEA